MVKSEHLYSLEVYCSVAKVEVASKYFDDASKAFSDSKKRMVYLIPVFVAFVIYIPVVTVLFIQDQIGFVTFFLGLIIGVITIMLIGLILAIKLKNSLPKFKP